MGKIIINNQTPGDLGQATRHFCMPRYKSTGVNRPNNIDND